MKIPPLAWTNSDSFPNFLPSKTLKRNHFAWGKWWNPNASKKQNQTKPELHFRGWRYSFGLNLFHKQWTRHARTFSTFCVCVCKGHPSDPFENRQPLPTGRRVCSPLIGRTLIHRVKGYKFIVIYANNNSFILLHGFPVLPEVCGGPWLSLSTLRVMIV